MAVNRGVIDGHEAIVVVQMFGKQVRENVVVSNASKNSMDDANVATADAGKVAGISDEMKLDVFFKNNSPTLIGWFSAFGLAILLVLIDLASVIHKKHEPLFILNKTKTQRL